MNNTGEKFCIDLKNGLDDLPLLTAKLELFFKPFPQLINPINLLMEELYSNSIYYGKAADLQVQILLEIRDDILCITYQDNGIAFDPFERKPDPNTDEAIEDRAIGGLGIHFVKNMTDQQCYKRKDGVNILFLEKNIKKR